MQLTRADVRQLISGLCEISDADFSCEKVYDFLNENPVDVDSITKYFYWSEQSYTRNLIYRDARFELMAICWEPGQVSRIHNHSGQKCWMTVPMGRLRGQNFAVDAINESRGYCKLRETDTFELTECLTAKVELEEPIHQMLNLKEFGQRAVSLHIYSEPYDRCLSYCRETDTYREVPLFYTSIGGKLCDGVML